MDYLNILCICKENGDTPSDLSSLHKSAFFNVRNPQYPYTHTHTARTFEQEPNATAERRPSDGGIDWANAENATWLLVRDFTIKGADIRFSDFRALWDGITKK